VNDELTEHFYDIYFMCIVESKAEIDSEKESEGES
jgi:hypothetical protein